MNKSMLIGRIANELELRYTKNGTAVCNFAIAVQRDFDKETADFIDVTAWKKTAENLTQYQDKGSLIAVEGRIQADNYEDKDGNKRKSVKVMADNVKFLGKKGG